MRTSQSDDPDDYRFKRSRGVGPVAYIVPKIDADCDNKDTLGSAISLALIVGDTSIADPFGVVKRCDDADDVSSFCDNVIG